MRSEKPFFAAKTIFAIFVMFLLVSVAATQAHARKFKVLHTFHGAPDDGAIPDSELLRDPAGNIYGTTIAGGRAKGTCPQGGCGTAFKMDKAGKTTWLYRFSAPKSNNPEAGLLRDKAGRLYGTTVLGGDTKCYSSGCGTVFRLDSTGKKEAVLHKFTGTPDGSMPTAPLIEDAAGNLYGTTYLGGGTPGYGTVFKLDTAGNETILHNFAGPPGGGGDGALAYEGLTRDAAGNLYSVTAEGGADGVGVVYKLDTAGNETLLYSFRGGSDGSYPNSALVPDSAGNLYGTTDHGGNGQCGGIGCGTVFKLTPGSGGNWTESVLYVFCSQSNCDDGEFPHGLTLDAAGNVYGTTTFGGAYQNCNGEACGVVYKLDAAGKETVLHDFTGRTDGGAPVAPLVMDSAGNLYGTTQLGGDPNCTVAGDSGCGVAFKLTP
jgi:uncharacterized repeat protein (TIGR03803 family)